MSVGFGFSAGDFIAALALVKNVIDALNDTVGSTAEYRGLMDELTTHQSALLALRDFCANGQRNAQFVALLQAAARIQLTINDFWRKISKYQLCLADGGSGSRIEDGWRKLSWALCQKDEVARFRAQLCSHTGSINILLMTIHM
ncbi:hypothetical protein MMC17_004263 [Xylographa soralifera]|nr:hypothetical protein [Xylographa soralifera]